MASKVDQLARRWRDAQHVAQQVGGRAAQQELQQATAALKAAAGTRRR